MRPVKAHSRTSCSPARGRLRCGWLSYFWRPKSILFNICVYLYCKYGVQAVNQLYIIELFTFGWPAFLMKTSLWIRLLVSTQSYMHRIFLEGYKRNWKQWLLLGELSNQESQWQGNYFSLCNFYTLPYVSITSFKKTNLTQQWTETQATRWEVLKVPSISRVW